MDDGKRKKHKLQTEELKTKFLNAIDLSECEVVDVSLKGEWEQARDAAAPRQKADNKIAQNPPILSDYTDANNWVKEFDEWIPMALQNAVPEEVVYYTKKV